MPREADFMRKQESKNANYEDNANTSNASSSSAWSRFNDPRIVRVSKALGGKDRHSKVCTVRGLRDRRVRLSVPTAIQLYDLQERLGVNQPSKVVDWLLDAAKHEIDELPPLHFPQGSLITQRFNPIIASQSDKQGLKIVGNGMSKETSDRNDDHHQSWTRSSGEERQLNLENQGDYVSTSDFLSRQNPSSFSSLLSSTTAPYNSFVRWDPSNLTLSHPPIGLGLTAHVEDSTNFNLSPQQLLVYQPSTNTQSYFPSQISPPTNTTFDLKQTNSTQPVIRPLQFNMTADLLPSQNNEADKLHSS